MHRDKVNAYTGHQQVSMDGRDVDKTALLNCASRLKIALDDGGNDMALYQEAIRHNQKLWTMFQIAVMNPESPLPNSLKSQLMTLSAYIDRTSFRAIHKFQPALLTSMIDINRIIAAGLARKVQQTQMQQPNLAVPQAVAGTPAAVMTSA